MNMKDIPPHQDRRLDRRLPLGCPAFIALRSGERVDATCIEIGVGGMTLHAAYVPARNEIIDVAVLGEPGPLGGQALVLQRQLLGALVQRPLAGAQRRQPFTCLAALPL